jgi:hypothetical protein
MEARAVAVEMAAVVFKSADKKAKAETAAVAAAITVVAGMAVVEMVAAPEAEKAEMVGAAMEEMAVVKAEMAAVMMAVV